MLRRLVRTWTQGHQNSTITKDNLFDTIPADCDQECHSCTIKYPASFKIEEGSDLWQTGDEWATHLIVATGKSDWVRDVSNEKGSIMEAISRAKKPTNGKLKVSASNMCPPPEYYTESSKPTTCVILPSWTQVEMVTPDDVQELVDKFISPGPTTTTPLEHLGLPECATKEAKNDSAIAPLERLHVGDSDNVRSKADGSTSDDETTQSEELATLTISATSCPTAADLAASSYLKSYECPHDYLILLCSHKHRDARCGQSAPLLLKELRRHLQPLGLDRDLDDYRPGGVGIFFINHVGGHKWSANMIIYRKKAGQGIWLARVRPQDIEAIVKWTVLEGKVQPDKIRAGFDRSRGVTSW